MGHKMEPECQILQDNGGRREQKITPGDHILTLPSAASLPIPPPPKGDFPSSGVKPLEEQMFADGLHRISINLLQL